MDLPYRKNVCAIIINSDKKVLIVLKPGFKSWQFVQGGVDKGESLEEALAREIKEEVGITNFEVLGVSKYHNQYDWPADMQKNKGFRGQMQSFFVVKVSKDVEIILEKNELAEYKWVSMNKVKKYLTFEGLSELFDKIREEFKGIL